ncbi:hypothetical protein EJ08DRAFT_677049 [Tothia fuscella]|uniref:Uncharacterized protein n=1 Tax=Tothia fuscella TaxID=1048955 RepID=A0A9P4U038_9PEZI|nr:hypothetical protein EJ08DRAFT_677049 [Tothia fuscella]
MFSSGSICLRCQSRILRNRLRPSLAAAPRSRFSALHRRSKEKDIIEAVPVRYTTDDPPSFKSERRLLGKVRGKRGIEVREGSAALSIDSLGKKAEVIILRDAGFEHRDDVEEEEGDDIGGESSVESLQRKTSLNHEAILRSIEDAKKDLSQDEVNAQIEELCPKAGINATLSEQDYNELCEVLRESYSSAQLRGYCQSKREELEKRKAEEKKRRAALADAQSKEDGGSAENPDVWSSSTVKEITLPYSPWKAGTTSIKQRPSHRMVQPALRISKARDDKKTKNDLLEDVVRTYWQLDVVTEAGDTIGELEFRPKLFELELFTAGNPSRLTDIGRKQGAKIEVYRPQNVIRITADRTTAMQTLESFDDLRLSIISRVIKDPTSTGATNDLPKGKVSRDDNTIFTEDMKKIANLTRTVISPNREEKTFTIRSTDLDSIYDARRALHTIMAVSAAPPAEVLRSLSSKALLRPVTMLESLPYRDRKLTYSRLYLPVATSRSLVKVADPTAADSSTSPDDAVIQTTDHPHENDLKAVRAAVGNAQAMLFTPSKLENLRKEATTNPNEADGSEYLKQNPSLLLWTQPVETIMSATVGEVLHQTLASSTFTWMKPSKTLMRKPTHFSRTVPSLTTLLNDFCTSSSTHDVPSDILSFRLFPDPWALNPQTYLPELRLDFKVNPLSEEIRTADFLRMYAVIDQATTNVMLPSQAVDLSFQKKTLLPLHPAGIEANETLMNYIQKTKENIEGGGRLRAPHVLQLGLPGWMTVSPTSFHEHTNLRSSDSKKPNLKKILQGEELVKGSYFFVGVEHRETVSFAFEDGFPLYYNSVEAGQLGGCYGELKIQMSEGPRAVKNLLDKASELVERVDSAVFGRQPVTKSVSAKEKKSKTAQKTIPGHARGKVQKKDAEMTSEQESKARKERKAKVAEEETAKTAGKTLPGYAQQKSSFKAGKEREAKVEEEKKAKRALETTPRVKRGKNKNKPVKMTSEQKSQAKEERQAKVTELMKLRKKEKMAKKKAAKTALPKTKAQKTEPEVEDLVSPGGERTERKGKGRSKLETPQEPELHHEVEAEAKQAAAG